MANGSMSASDAGRYTAGMRAATTCLVLAIACTQPREVTLQVAGAYLGDTITSPVATISSVVYREGRADAWRSLPVANGGVTFAEYELDVDAEYEVVALGSGSDGTPLVAELLASVEEDASPILAVGGEYVPAPSAPVYQVAVSMQQAGTIYAGDYLSAASSTGPWTGTLALGSGAWDVVALDAAGSNVAIRHDVRVDGDVTVPTFDLTREGAALVPASVTVSGFDDPFGAVSVGVSLTTPTLSLAISSSGVGPDGNVVYPDTASLLAVPASQLAAGDAQGFFASQQDDRGNDETAFVDLSRSQLAFPPDPSVSYASTPFPVVTWTGSASSIWFATNQLTVTATSAWFGDGGHDVAIDTSFPGFAQALLGTAIAGYELDDRSSTGYTTVSGPSL
jgi:hypothetical protein